MKFLFAYFWDIIIQYHTIILLRLVLIWSKILVHIWYQSIMIGFGLRIAAEYHNHYLTIYQKAATQYSSDIDWKLSKKKRKKERISFPCFVHPTPFIVCVFASLALKITAGHYTGIELFLKHITLWDSRIVKWLKCLQWFNDPPWDRYITQHTQLKWQAITGDWLCPA